MSKNSKVLSILEQIAEIDREIAKSEAELKRLEGAMAEKLADAMINENTPRTMAMGDILNDEQIQAVVDILNRPGLAGTDYTKQLKAYLNRFKNELETIGVSADYLAYALYANAGELRRLAKESNSKPGPGTLPPNSHN